MIIRRQLSRKVIEDEREEISIPFERLCYIARKKAVLLTLAALIGFGLGLVYVLYQFSLPVETRLENDILLIGYPGTTGTTGVTGVTGVTTVTGVREIDSVLSTFEPQIKIQEIAQRWPDLALLDEILSRSGLRRADAMVKQISELKFGSAKKTSSRFLVQGDDGGKFMLLMDFQAPRNKPPQVVIQAGISETQMRPLVDNIFKNLNQRWSQEALELAKTQRPFAEKIRAKLLKQSSGGAQNLPQMDQLIQINVDQALLSNYQRVRLIDQFLDKLKDWPAEMCFAFPGKKIYWDVRPNRALLALPVVSGAGFLLGFLLLLNFVGPLAGKVLGEQDLASAHPEASIYSTKIGSAQLVSLVARSFAHAFEGKEGKLVAFVPHDDKRIAEYIRIAADKSGRLFGLDGSKDSEVTLVSSRDPSDSFSRLQDRGFCRILLSSKQGESWKMSHQLLQAEADLVGISITDVILITP